LERQIVRPDILVALGATAVRSVSGRPLAINTIRGRVIPLPDGGRMLATIHPSYILRIHDEADKRAQYRQFVADLKVCAKALADLAA
jgi:uracil-DNA glycosylase